MIQLNLFEKIQTLFDIIKSSRLFIVSFIVCISLITIMFLDYKSNKKVNDKLFVGVFISSIIFIIMKYANGILSLSDNLVEEVIESIYFPNLTVYLTMVIFVNIICIYTLIKNKFYTYKLISTVSATLIDFNFILTLDTIIKNNIDVYEKLTVYSNKELLVLIQLTSMIFTIYVFLIGFVKLVNITIKEQNVPQEEQVKKIPDYVIPEPLEMVSLYNNEAFVPVENITCEVKNFTGEELYQMFNRGENLTREQYTILKNYIMTK